MKTTLKKTLSILLAILMIVTTIPMAFAAETSQHTYSVGEIIQYGSYPQTKVTDEALVAELDALAPAWDNWTSYGYYTGTDSYDTMKQGDWMRYTDIMYNGNKYRGVKFTQYKPYNTNSSSSSSYQDDNGYSTNTVYWFKFEPIDWRVLDPATGLVMCETIIDSQPYSNTIYYNRGASDSGYSFFNDASYTNYASDYETSSIRQWLNDDFYNTAFTDSEKKEINTTNLNNDGYYTSIGTTGYEVLDSNSTNDKIFLLSHNEVRNSNFGFNSSYSAYDPARFAQGSDYAKSQGLWVSTSSSYYGNSYWLLRSPGRDSGDCCCVYDRGYSISNCSVYYSGSGVRPALTLNLQSANPHKVNTVTVEAKAPNCTEIGWDTYEYCTVCDYSTYVEKSVIPEAHDIVIDEAVAPDCTNAGLTEGSHCSRCDGATVAQEVVSALDHDIVIDEAVAPDCTNTGLTEGQHCSRCDDMTVAQEVVSALDHDIVIDEAVAPDCTNTGLTEGQHCSRCDDMTVAQEVVSALDHDIVIDEAVAPTCTETGLTEGSHCSRCDDMTVAQEVVSALDHDIVIDEAVAPDCTNTGLTEGSHCSRCDDMTVAQEEIAALGHADADGDGKCDNGGEDIACPDCGKDVHGDTWVENLVCWLVMLFNLIKTMF